MAMHHKRLNIITQRIIIPGQLQYIRFSALPLSPGRCLYLVLGLVLLPLTPGTRQIVMNEQGNAYNNKRANAFTHKDQILNRATMATGQQLVDSTSDMA